MPQEEKRVLTMDKYERGVLIRALNDLRTGLIDVDKPTEVVDELLLKTIDCPQASQVKLTKKRGRGEYEER